MHRHLELNICENPVGEWFSSFMSLGYSPVVKGDCLGDRDNFASVVTLGFQLCLLCGGLRCQIQEGRIFYTKDCGYCSVIFCYSITVIHPGRKEKHQNPNGREGVMVSFNHQLNIFWNHLRESLNKGLSRSGLMVIDVGRSTVGSPIPYAGGDPELYMYRKY